MVVRCFRCCVLAIDKSLKLRDFGESVACISGLKISEVSNKLRLLRISCELVVM